MSASSDHSYAMAPVRASTRVSIAWSGAPPDEDTDTLVLTIDGYSLDLRVFISGPDAGAIDWASVGLVSEVESKDGDIALQWDHLIDSRGSLPEDAGSFSVLPNGDVREAGVMYNPKTDRTELFEEVWRRHPRAAGWPYVVLERVDGKWAIGDKNRAFLGRIGPRVLGLAQDGAVFRAYRSDAGELVYEFEGSADVLPRLPQSDEGYSVGETVTIGAGQWVVRVAGTLP